MFKAIGYDRNKNLSGYPKEVRGLIGSVRRASDFGSKGLAFDFLASALRVLSLGKIGKDNSPIIPQSTKATFVFKAVVISFVVYVDFWSLSY